MGTRLFILYAVGGQRFLAAAFNLNQSESTYPHRWESWEQTSISLIVTLNIYISSFARSDLNAGWTEEVKKSKLRALNETPSQSCRMSLAIRDHTVLPVIRHKWTHSALTSDRGRYSICLPRRDGRLSWLMWLVTYRDGLPAHRRASFKDMPVGGLHLFL